MYNVANRSLPFLPSSKIIFSEPRARLLVNYRVLTSADVHRARQLETDLANNERKLSPQEEVFLWRTMVLGGVTELESNNPLARLKSQIEGSHRSSDPKLYYKNCYIGYFPASSYHLSDLHDYLESQRLLKEETKFLNIGCGNHDRNPIIEMAGYYANKNIEFMGIDAYPHNIVDLLEVAERFVNLSATYKQKILWIANRNLGFLNTDLEGKHPLNLQLICDDFIEESRIAPNTFNLIFTNAFDGKIDIFQRILAKAARLSTKEADIMYIGKFGEKIKHAFDTFKGSECKFKKVNIIPKYSPFDLLHYKITK